MRHLTEVELLDVAEGTEASSRHPHLATCATCTAQVSELRAMLWRAAEASVPEPSPPFWDHLSARVREGIEQEAAKPRIIWNWVTWRVALPAAGLAALILAAVVSVREPAAIPDLSTSNTVADAVEPLDAPADDPSLTLIADLVGELDWDGVAEAGLTSGAGAAERLLLDMSADERLELQQILKQELARQGA
jgi:hypothetical protein